MFYIGSENLYSDLRELISDTLSRDESNDDSYIDISYDSDFIYLLQISLFITASCVVIMGNSRKSMSFIVYKIVQTNFLIVQTYKNYIFLDIFRLLFILFMIFLNHYGWHNCQF